MRRDQNAERMNRLKRSAVGFVVTSIVLFSWYGFRMYQDRVAADAILAEYSEAEAADALNNSDAQTLVDASPGQQAIPKDMLGNSRVQWNGTVYRRNSHVKAILCIGVDRGEKLTELKGYNEAGQADAVFLLAQDTARNQLKILMIPRDTMAEIGIINLDMSDAGVEVRQLALAYANGDGREKSCENTVTAVESLLHGFTVDAYLAADMEMISLLNDAVGGVTVTVPTAGMEKKNPAFVKGEIITLYGEQAEQFVRYRDIESAYSAMYRMDQQQEYITGFFEAVKETSKENSQIVTQLFELAEDYIVTDMGKDQYLKLALDALNQGGLEKQDFYTLPGSGVATDVYEEYYADEKGMIQVMLNLFYRESSV